MLSGKVALITGGGRGIGRAIAIELAKEGVNIIVCARTKFDVEKVADQIKGSGGKAVAIKADVSSEIDVRNLISKSMKKFGRIDILINNAGVGSFAPVSDLSVKDFDTMWKTNMRGVFLCTKMVLQSMIERKSGDIVNIASLAGRNAFEGGAGYCATKWALIGFSRCLMLEVRKHNIRVITICPGSVATSFSKGINRKKNNSRIPTAEDIAQIVVDALKMPQNVMMSEIDVRPTNPNL